ncbi:Kinesin-like protein [Trichinella pseudospiralis]
MLFAHLNRTHSCLVHQLKDMPVVVVPGAKSVLSMEVDALMVELPIVSSEELANEITALTCWDSSVHDCVLISHPIQMHFVLRKRICLSLSRPPSLPGRWLRKLHAQGICHGTGVYYDLVAHLPRGSCSAEANASLALVAARNDDHRGKFISIRSFETGGCHS